MSGTVPSALRTDVEQLDQGRCAYCCSPQDLSVAAFELDHIVPIVAGGRTVVENLCLTCPACNRHKAARQFGTDPQTAKIVPLYNPRTQTWLEHFRWDGVHFTVEGLTPVGRATIQLLRVNRPQLVHLRRLWGRLEIQPWADFVTYEEST